LLGPANPYEVTKHFLHRLYQPIVEAASREANLPASAKLHIFSDISLTGHSAVLVVLFPAPNKSQQLLLLDAAKAWDLVFPDADAFNTWAEERFRWIMRALRTAPLDFQDDLLKPAI
jgi:hypothetical protein